MYMHHTPRVREFPEQPDVLDLGFRRKELHSPYRYMWFQDGRWVRLTVPIGFIYNGASVPSALWSLFPPHSLDKAAVFHDFLYRAKGIIPTGSHEYWDGEAWAGMTPVWTRSQADDLFGRMLKEDPRGPGAVRRSLAYRVVRLFGGGSWGPRTLEDFMEPGT